jgi:uncharacterized membrane protein YqjE
MSSDEAAQGGLFASLKRLTATLLGIGRTRLELLCTELEEERVRLTSMLVWGLAALFCAALGIVLLTLLVVVYFWDTHRLLALGFLMLAFFLGAAVAGSVALNKAKTKPRLFSASLAELSRDHVQLKAGDERETA